MKRDRLQSLAAHKLPGYTLTELLVVLVIIGILVLLVLPDQTAVITKAKATEAKLQLKALQNLQKAHHYEFSKYTASLDDIDFKQQMLVTDGGQANYRIEIVEASPAAFKATATSVVDFNNDGQFNVWQIDQDNNLKEIVKD